MFTGIITDVGRLVATNDRNDGRMLRIETSYDPKTIAIGASIACDGICLTVTDRGEAGRNWFEVFAARETMDVTEIGEWRKGRRINLERSLKIGDDLDGHVVQGHVDGSARIVGNEEIGDQIAYEFEASAELAPFIAKKGSVALNGTSLTVNSVSGNRFTVHLIPHTVAVTAWSDYQIGDLVNIEVDPMARYAARLLEARAEAVAQSGDD
jgi:riboflavin synthase